MEDTKIAFLGLGNMGGGMALRLVKKDFPVTVHNRTAAKAAPIVEAGGRQAGSPEEAVAGADVVMLSLSDETAVDQVLFGRVLPVLAPGTPVIDTSTVSPEYARRAAERLTAAGMHRVEACVVGNPQQAARGQLRVFAAGDEAQVERLGHVLGAVGHQVRYLGPPGTAATLKLVFNAVLGVQVAGLAEGVAYGVRAGLDRDLLLRAVADSGFSSLVMKFRAELMLRRDYEPAYFRSRLMEKDLRLALEDAEGSGPTLPVLDAVRERYADLITAGAGDQDAAVLLEHSIRPPLQPAAAAGPGGADGR